MNTNPMVEKVRESFSYVFSYLQQTGLAPREEISKKLLQLDEVLRQLIEQETDERVKLNLTYPLIYVDSSLDNLTYLDPVTDRFAVDQAREGVRIAFQIFSRLYADTQ